jgi:predicted ATPase
VGSANTRLAIEAGMQLIDEFVDGVWFCDLAAVTDLR